MDKYTINFIKKGNQLLLLNRCKKPAMGLWNGVGGKIEKGETPVDGVIRETEEETGLLIEEVVWAGEVFLNSEKETARIFVFTSSLTNSLVLDTPLKTDEGVLDWKDISWVLDEDNMGIVDNVKKYFPYVLNGDFELEHKFEYKQGKLVSYENRKLEEGAGEVVESVR